MKSLISFFTRIPVEGSLEDAAEKAYLLPFVAVLISFPASLSFYFLNLHVDSKLSALISLAVIYFISGLIHLDALADFADGIYARSLRAMKDVNVGIAGTFALVFVVVGTLYSLSLFNSKSFYEIFLFFLTAEVGAKLSMVTMIAFSKPLNTGLGKLFIEKMSKQKFVFSLILSIILTLNFTVLIAVAVGLLMKFISERTFGGVNGDCIGASNEITRLLLMMIMLTIGVSSCYL